MEKVEGKTAQLSQEKVFGGGDGGIGISITKRPNTADGEAFVGTKRPKQAEGEVVAPIVGIERPKAEGEVVAGVASSGLADDDSLSDGTIGGAVEAGSEELSKYAVYYELEPEKRVKKKILATLDKKACEIHVSAPPPRPFPRMSDELIDKLEEMRRLPGKIRAYQDEMTAYGQKFIDRDAEIRRQYELQGYAEIELTDNEDDFEELGLAR